MHEALERAARAAGIEIDWTDAFGQANRLSEARLRKLLDVVGKDDDKSAEPPLLTTGAGELTSLPESLQRSRHITLRDEDGEQQRVMLDGQHRFIAPMKPGYYEIAQPACAMRLAVAPPACFGPADCFAPDQSRGWGLAAQVYSLRRPNDGGLGDSGAVEQLAAMIGRYGGDAIALSPNHAVAARPRHYSPYTPSHRAYLDWAYADPAQVFGTEPVERAIDQAGLRDAWSKHAASSLIDWTDVRAMRRRVLQTLKAGHLHESVHRLNDLHAFTDAGGARLREHARFMAEENLAHAERSADAMANEEAFEIFAQWLASRCWEKTQQAAKDAGQRIGLIWDLAVGCDPHGSEASAYRDALLRGVQLGAPPDAFNRAGQQWGITSYSPRGLIRSGFQPFIDLLRANMARGGGIRIDHIIGLQRLWVVPEGGDACGGGYLRYPLADLLRLLALESWRQRCIVIGEDLGTVPPGIRHTLAQYGVLGIDVLLFMRDETGNFLPPDAWRESAVATTTTHDLPTLTGWRRALDLQQLASAQAWSMQMIDARNEERRQDVAKLADATGAFADGSAADQAQANWPYFAYVAQSPAPLLLIPAEDAVGKAEQPNLPGTIDSYPNWRQRLPVDGQAQLDATLAWLQRCAQRGIS